MANLEDKGKDSSLTHSGFEKRGGYASGEKAPAKLPTVDSGPAPGAQSGGTKKPASDD